MPQHPPAAETFFDLGYQHLKKLDFAQAAPCFQAALALAPGFLEAHVNLGWSLEKLGSLDEAEASYRRALALDPACLRAGLNLGVLLVGRKRFADAEEVYAQTLRDHPDAAAAWSNLGVLETLAKREVEAEAHLRKAMALDPGYARARFNLSYLLLRQGRFEEGWPALEARELSPFTARFAFPPWRGEDLRGKSLLIGIEKGHGDMLQFCRYVPLLKARGAARIGLVCHGALARLLRPMEGLDALFPLEDGIPTDGWDHWTLPLSLPLHCGTRMDTIPAALPYLRSDPDLVEAWRGQLPETGLRVGLAWKGNPRFENDADRSLPHLSCLAPLALVPDVRLVSLQKGRGEAEPAEVHPGMDVLDLSPRIHDFADLAAIMANLDLVVSVDSAAAHLAGALGKACWILLPDHLTDWRWLTEREDSPWYPGAVRLFRQSADQAWAPVIARAAAELEGLVRPGRMA